MQIIAMDRLKPGVSEERIGAYLLDEIRAGLVLYLKDKIRTFWFRQDAPGAVLLMECESMEEARSLVDSLPFVTEGIVDFDLIPIGPFAPLAMVVERI